MTQFPKIRKVILPDGTIWREYVSYDPPTPPPPVDLDKLEKERERRRLLQSNLSNLSPTLSQTVLSEISPTVIADTDRLLVICVKFPDQSNMRSTTDIGNDYFSTSPTTKSVYNFFKENSRQQYLLSGAIYGWYTLLNNRSYYEDNIYRLNDAAVDIIKNDPNINLGYIDKNGDHYIDYIAIVYAGYGFTIGSLAGANGTSSSIRDGYSSKYFTYCSEKPYVGTSSSLGTFCHELSHLLGFVNRDNGGLTVDDLYFAQDTVGNFSLMAFGNWLDNGYTPCHLDGINKWILGFSNTYYCTAGDNRNIPNAEGLFNINYIFKSKFWNSLRDDTGDIAPGLKRKYEFFLVENRQQVGYDTYLPGNGLLIWHAYYEILTNAQYHQVKIKQADGLNQIPSNGGDAGDTFPGTSNNRHFGTGTNPNTSLRDGTVLNIDISDISNSTTIMTADFQSCPCPVLQISMV